MLLRVGALSGWLGSAAQIPGAQEIAKDLISESSAIFERLGQTEKFYLEQIRQKNLISYFEFPAVASDGSEVWIGQNVQLVIENGEVVELQALGRDITARKRIEQQLLDSEQRYRLLFEANPHPMWVYDFETLSFLTANNAAVQSYGYSLEDFLSMTILDIRPPHERQCLGDHLPKRESGTLPEPWIHLKKDGSIIDVEITAFPLIFYGKKAELITATDVTARLRAAGENLRLEDAYPKLIAAAVGWFLRGKVLRAQQR